MILVLCNMEGSHSKYTYAHYDGLPGDGLPGWQTKPQRKYHQTQFDDTCSEVLSVNLVESMSCLEDYIQMFTKSNVSPISYLQSFTIFQKVLATTLEN